MVNILNLFVRFSLWIIMSLLFIPVGEFIKRFCPKARIRTANLYHTLLCKILGIKMIIKGKQDLEGPVFFVSNHQSYLDIPVISCVTRARFVSKSEVRKWPLIGYLAELQNTIFIKRDKKEAGRQSSQLSENIKAGDSIIAFPEGTSGDGHKVLKFKSTLFSIADEKVKYGEEERYLKVQPISIYFSKLNGEPVTYHDRQYYSWIGDEGLFPHLPRFFNLGKKEVVLEFHPVVSMDEFKNRKEMAKYCEDVIGHRISQRISGKV